MRKSKDIIKDEKWKVLNKEILEQNEILEKWMLDNYGLRCRKYIKGCALCKKWEAFDKLLLDTF
jgi:hypothetical protein